MQFYFQYLSFAIVMYIAWRSFEKVVQYGPEGAKGWGRRCVRILALVALLLSLWCMVNIFIMNRPHFSVIEGGGTQRSVASPFEKSTK